MTEHWRPKPRAVSLIGSEWTPVGGKWRFNLDEFHHDGSGLPETNSDFHYMLSPVEIQDGILEGKVRLPSKNGDNSGRLVFRHSPWGSYEAGLGGWAKHYSIGRLVRTPDAIRGSYSLASAGSVDQIRFGEQYPFRVEFVGPSLKLFLGDAQLLACDDPFPLLSGRIGVQTYGPTSVTFSDLRAFRIDRRLEHLVELLHRFPQAIKREPIVGSEKDMQRILWTMLRSNYEDLEDEEVLRKFGLKHYRDDFGIPSLRTIVEAKYIGPDTDPKRIQDEIMVDAVGYFAADSSRYDSLIAIIMNGSGRPVPDAMTRALEELKVIQRVIVLP